MLRNPSLLLALVTGFTLGCASSEAPKGARLEHRPSPAALGPYSGSVLVGDLVFVSGKVGQADTTFEREAETAIDAVATELDSLDMGLKDVASAMVHLRDIDDYAAFNEVYERRFPWPYPARTCVAVDALPGRRRVEITVIAVRRTEG